MSDKDLFKKDVENPEEMLAKSGNPKKAKGNDLDSLFDCALENEKRSYDTSRKKDTKILRGYYGELLKRFDLVSKNYEGLEDVLDIVHANVGYWKPQEDCCLSFPKTNGARSLYFNNIVTRVNPEDYRHVIKSVRFYCDLKLSHNHFGFYHDTKFDEADYPGEILDNGLPDIDDMFDIIDKFDFENFHVVSNACNGSISNFRSSSMGAVINYVHDYGYREEDRFWIQLNDMDSDSLPSVAKQIYINIFNKEEIDFDAINNIVNVKR